MSLLDILIFAVNSVMPLILIVVLGYYLKQTGFLTKDFLKIGNKTVFRVLLPVLLFTNIAEMEDFTQLRLDVLAYVIVAIAILFIIGLCLCSMIKDNKQKGVILQCVFRSNFALIGVPLAQLMAGEKGVQTAALLSAFTIPTFNILSVISLCAYVGSEGQATSPSKRIKKILAGIIHNPLIISVFLGIVFVCLKPLWYSLPSAVTDFTAKLTFIQTTLNYLAKASTPVALLVLGGQFEISRIQSLKNQIILGTTARLLFAPLAGIGGAVLLHRLGFVVFDNATYAALISLFGTPVAVASAIMAEEMNNDGQLAGQLVVWTTLCSAFTIFFIVAVLRGMGLL